ncbi:hypothetical protein JCM16138_16170 [Thermococcus atlanticus]
MTASPKTHVEKSEETLKTNIKNGVKLIFTVALGTILSKYNYLSPYITIETIAFAGLGTGVGLTFWYVRQLGKDITQIRKDIEHIKELMKND